MRLSTSEITERVNDYESLRRPFIHQADRAERMFRLEAFDKRARQQLEEEGMEQVVLPTPHNVVNLGLRLVSDTVRIEAMSKQATAESNAMADKRSRWLTAAWYALSNRQGRSLIDALAWQTLTLGRHACQVQWIKDALPERKLDTEFPINVRILDPRAIGVKRGPFGPEWAYHKYECELWEAVKNWPEIKNRKVVADKRRAYKADNRDNWRSEKVNMVDFWYEDEKGHIWNAVLMDDEFVKTPVQTDYPAIPIIEGFGDTAETDDEGMKGLSILFSIDGLWQYQCRAMSQMATGMLWHFWPHVWATNEHGAELNDIKIRPGQIEVHPAGTAINVTQIEPNMPLASQIMGIVDTNVQQSTFPGVMYGDAPGQLQAGYGVSMLADAARGRMRSFLSNLERTIQSVNKLMMGLVLEFDDDDEGVEVWGRNVKDGKLFNECLYKEELEGGYYENAVELKAQLPEDDNNKLMLGIRLAEGGAISYRTFRDKWLGMDLPDDEENRIFLERAMMGQELGPKSSLAAIMAYYPNDWADIIKGTPFEQVAQMAGLLPMPPQQPPMGGEGMPPGGEGMMPGGPEEGMPPITPDAMAGPMGSPMSNHEQGIPTPEELGLPADFDPVLWAQMTGRPLPPGEEDDAMMR